MPRLGSLEHNGRDRFWTAALQPLSLQGLCTSEGGEVTMLLHEGKSAGRTFGEESGDSV